LKNINLKIQKCILVAAAMQAQAIYSATIFILLAYLMVSASGCALKAQSGLAFMVLGGRRG
jgi:hypothetical protein